MREPNFDTNIRFAGNKVLSHVISHLWNLWNDGPGYNLSPLPRRSEERALPSIDLIEYLNRCAPNAPITLLLLGQESIWIPLQLLSEIYTPKPYTDLAQRTKFWWAATFGCLNTSIANLAKHLAVSMASWKWRTRFSLTFLTSSRPRLNNSLTIWRER